MVSILIVPLILSDTSWVDDPPHLYVSPYSCILNSHQNGLLNSAYSNWRTFPGHSSKEPYGQIITVMIPFLPNFFISCFSCYHGTIPEESSLRKRGRIFFWLTVLSEGMVHHGRENMAGEHGIVVHVISTVSELRVIRASIRLAFSFECTLHPQPMEWYCLYFGDSFYHS